jgi:hypothetical protein
MGLSMSYRGQIANVVDRQPESTEVQHPQPERDIAGVGPMADPVFIEDRIVAMCRDELDAINLCIDLSRMSDETLCSQLGIDKGHWSRMRKGRAHFPTAKRIALMRLAGNWAPIQYELGKSGVSKALHGMWKARRDEEDRLRAVVAAKAQASSDWQGSGIAA